MKVINIKELTRKEKFRGLTKTSWSLTLVIASSLFPSLGFYVLFLAICMLSFFYVIEFFDEDFLEIIVKKINLRSGNEFYI